ncbi:MAG: PAS domain S-box protein, partial [Methanomicrobiales archaeon]
MYRVLHVDPEATIREHFHRHLTRTGLFAVDSCETGEAALTHLEQDRYDAVVSEIELSEMDGLALLAGIREREWPIPVLFYTGEEEPRTIIAALNRRAAAFVAKEGDPQAECDRLGRLLTDAIQERGNRRLAEEYRTVVESQTEFICRFLPDGTHIFANDAYCRYFGMSADEIIGSRFIPGIPSDDRTRVESHLASLTPDQPVASIRHRIVMPGGEVRWQRWNDRAIFDDDGTVVEYQSVGRDITDVIEMEEVLREAQERYAAVVEFLPDPALAIDREGRVVTWNRAMEDLTGVSAAEMLGKGNFEYAIPFYGERRPILIDLVLQHDDDLLETRYAHVHRNGDFLAAETTLLRIGGQQKVLWGKAAPLFDREGERAGAIEVIRDITERRYYEDLYRGVMEHSGTAMIVFDRDGTLLAVNGKAEELSGYPREELVGRKKWIEFVDPADRERMVGYHRLREQHPDQAPEEYEFRMVDRDGERHDILLSVGSIRGSGRFVASLIDITGRKRMEEALRRSEERFHGLFIHMPAGVAVYEVVGDGEDFVFADYNPAAEAIDSIPREEVIGRSIFDVFPGVEEYGLVDLLRQVWETGEPAQFPATRYRDERIEGWRENYVFRLSSGEVVAIFSDVTREKQAEEALRRSEASFRSLAESLD